MEDIKIYEPKLGLSGNITQLVRWANAYTADYSDEALEHISELARQMGADEKCIQIPLLLKAERRRENEAADGVGTPYERMKIDYYTYGDIGYSESNYTTPGTELEIRSEGNVVLISLTGCDDGGDWSAADRYSVDEFMAGDYGWLDKTIGNILYYNKTYEEG